MGGSEPGDYASYGVALLQIAFADTIILDRTGFSPTHLFYRLVYRLTAAASMSTLAPAMKRTPSFLNPESASSQSPLPKDVANSISEAGKQRSCDGIFDGQGPGKSESRGTVDLDDPLFPIYYPVFPYSVFPIKRTLGFTVPSFIFASRR